MKGLLSASVIASICLNMGIASALDMKPGEWQMATMEFYAHNLETNAIIDEKTPDAGYKLCYTPQMTADLKKMKKGMSSSGEGCTVTFIESSASRMVNETVCNTKQSQSHSTVETTKVSDNEFLMVTTGEDTTPGSRMKSSSKVKQTFISETCSEATNGLSAK